MVAYVQKCNTQSGTRDFSCWYVIVYDRFIVLQHTTYLYNDEFVVIHIHTHTGTDSRYLRELGIPAFGFSPMNFTPVLLHDHNEFLNARVFLDGIAKFVGLIESLANIVEVEEGVVVSKEEE